MASFLLTRKLLNKLLTILYDMLSTGIPHIDRIAGDRAHLKQSTLS